ncbi:MAG: hypothetical protein PHD56_03730 [Anaerostipes sp.]|nr:hypothetical protein [Anaerostipes sp.]
MNQKGVLREKYGEGIYSENLQTGEFKNVPFFGDTGTLSAEFFEGYVDKVEFYSGH